MTRNPGRLPQADEQAEAFGRTRSDHRNEIAEDYVELIADLIDATGEARAVELAHQLHDGSRARMGDFSANYGLAVIDRLREANGPSDRTDGPEGR